MKPYYDEDGITIYHGDCREVMADLGPGGFDMVKQLRSRVTELERRLAA